MKALVLVGYGINCDEETQEALQLAFESEDIDGSADRIHINELVNRDKRLRDYQMLVFPGGFSYGDHIASGRALANKIRSYMADDVLRFVEDGNLILGICNGFQILIQLGLLPALDRDYTKQTATLAQNLSGNFEDRWVYLTSPDNNCVFTEGMRRARFPVAHGEGRFFASADVVRGLKEKGQVVFQYADETYQPANGEFPLNPNGSLEDIAGICDPSGRVLGMMPHPERFLHFVQDPDFVMHRERAMREDRIGSGADLPDEGLGRMIFQNTVRYLRGK